jgi:hypothetical protein
VDLSRIPGPEARSHDLALMSDLKDGWYAITNARRRVGFGMVWPVEAFRALWFWQVYGGALGQPWYGRTFNVGIEPWTTPDETLEEAMEAGTHRTLGPGESTRVVFKAVAYSGVGGVRRIRTSGAVEGRRGESIPRPNREEI